MDNLGLVNKFLIETGVSDVVQTLTDAADDVVQAQHWIDASWATIQTAKHWPFRRAETAHSIVNGTTAYAWDTLGLASGDIILPNSFYNAAGAIEQHTYYSLREIRRADAASLTTPDDSRLYKVAVHSGFLETYPNVATTQILAFDYLRGVQTLTADGDVPYGLPADFHMAIVHLAITKYGVLAGGAEGASLYASHSATFRKLMTDYQLYAGVDSEEDVPPITHTLL